MKKLLQLIFKMLGIIIFGLGLCIIGIAVLDKVVFSGSKSSALGITILMITIIAPLISIILGILSKLLINKKLVTLLIIFILWLVMFLYMKEPIVFTLFLIIYEVCGSLGEKIASFKIRKNNKSYKKV